MENESVNEIPEIETPVSYEERIARQEALVKKSGEEFEKKPSADLQLELNRKTDELRHLTNAAQGNPKERARQAAETARSVALNRAIQQ